MKTFALHKNVLAATADNIDNETNRKCHQIEKYKIYPGPDAHLLFSHIRPQKLGDDGLDAKNAMNNAILHSQHTDTLVM